MYLLLLSFFSLFYCFSLLQVAEASRRLRELDVQHEGLQTSILLRQVLRTVLTREGDLVHQLFQDQIMNYKLAKEVCISVMIIVVVVL